MIEELNRFNFTP